MPVFGFLGRDDDARRAMLEFNLLGAVRACRAALPAMLEANGGAIVNVTSTHARVPSATGGRRCGRPALLAASGEHDLC